MPSKICRFCDSEAEVKSINRVVRGYELFVCSICKSIGVIHRPSADELAAIYNDLFSHGNYKAHKNEHKQVLASKENVTYYRRYLLRRVKKICTSYELAEIGVGGGAFGNLARSEGWTWKGYDISKTAVSYARKIGLDANVFLEGSLPPLPLNGFNLVVMWEVLEHVYDVSRYLQKISASLQEGGVFLMSTPNYYRSAYQKSNDFGELGSPPVHVNFFTVESLKYLLEGHGFKDVSVYKRRIYRPNSKKTKEIVRSIQRALCIEEPPSIYAICRK